MPDYYTSQFSGEEIDSALRAAQIISGADTPAALREKLEIYGSNTALSPTDPTTVSTALKYRCNPNLLDNWYFGNPVNQRGQTEYTGGLSYCIDRWKLQSDTKLTLASDGVVLSGSWDMRELLENMPDGTYTLSCLYKDAPINVFLAEIIDALGGTKKRVVATQASGLITTTATITGGGGFLIGFLGGNNSATILAVKLELGSTQTLAHKEGDKWVLNEIPDYGEQLARCQRYCRHLSHVLHVCNYGGNFYAYFDESDIEMRTTPVFVNSLLGATVQSVTGSDAATVTNVYALTNRGGCAIQLSKDPGADHIFLTSYPLISADL